MGIVQEKMGKIKEKVKLPSRSRTISVFCAAGLIICLFLIWLFGTNTGWLAKQSFFKSFDHEPERLVRIYSGSELIATYEGHYTVEQYQGYLVVIDFDKEQRINVYGDVAAIVDTPMPQETKGE